MTADIELKEAVELKMEQKQLQSDGSGVGKASPGLSPKVSPDVPRPPIGSPSEILPGILSVCHVKTVATPKEARVKQEVLSASVSSLSDVSSFYAPLPNLLALHQKTNLSADVHDFIPRVHSPKETPCLPLARKKESLSPPQQRVSEQRTPYRSTSSKAQVAPQPVHTPLEQALLQTIQQLAQQSAQQVRHPEPQAGMAPWLTIAEALKVAEHSFRARFGWCNSARAQGFQKQTCRQ